MTKGGLAVAAQSMRADASVVRRSAAKAEGQERGFRALLTGC